jgi:hypothetical protein
MLDKSLVSSCVKFPEIDETPLGFRFEPLELNIQRYPKQ